MTDFCKYNEAKGTYIEAIINMIRQEPVSVPIFQSATFAHPGVGLSTGYDYSRVQNPIREHLENTIAKLETGESWWLTSWRIMTTNTQ